MYLVGIPTDGLNVWDADPLRQMPSRHCLMKSLIHLFASTDSLPLCLHKRSSATREWPGFILSRELPISPSCWHEPFLYRFTRPATPKWKGLPCCASLQYAASPIRLAPNPNAIAYCAPLASCSRHGGNGANYANVPPWQPRCILTLISTAHAIGRPEQECPSRRVTRLAHVDLAATRDASRHAPALASCSCRQATE